MNKLKFCNVINIKKDELFLLDNDISCYYIIHSVNLFVRIQILLLFYDINVFFLLQSIIPTNIFRPY